MHVGVHACACVRAPVARVLGAQPMQLFSEAECLHERLSSRLCPSCWPTLRCRLARQSLRNIILALTSSIFPVLNAYFVLLVAMCICEISPLPGAPPGD